ncbi:MAG: DUF485 domain-containing protein [Candidatus Sumerlaeia bacterium]
MLHEPAPQEQEVDNAMQYKTRLGVWMFIVYGLIYAAFVAINLTNPLLMEKKILFGMNLATVYGFGLIVVALIMALIYNALCGRQESALNTPKKKGNAQ